MKKRLLYFSLVIGMSFFSTGSFAKKRPPQDTLIQPEAIAVDTAFQPNNYYQQQEISSNMESLFRYQDEQRAKRKKAAMIRIGIGVAMMIVLVIGLMRKRKK